ILCLSLYPGDALVRLPNSPVEASVGIGLHIMDGGFGFRQQLIEKTIAFTFELIYPIFSLLQLSRELVCQCHRAVAILVRRFADSCRFATRAGSAGSESMLPNSCPEAMDCSLIDADFPSTNLHELEKQNS